MSVDTQHLEARLAGLAASHAALRRGRNLAIAIALLALVVPALMFAGVLSPQIKRLKVEAVEAREVIAAQITVTDGTAPGRISLSASGDSAVLSLKGAGSGVTAVAARDGLVSVDTKGEQSIYLKTSEDPVLGATVVATSNSVRSELHANRNSGEEAGVVLQMSAGTTELTARKYAVNAAFVGGLHVKSSGLTNSLDVGLSSNGPRVSLERRGESVVDSINIEATSGLPPSTYLAHRKDVAPRDQTTIGIIAQPGKPWIFGTANDDESWKLTAAKK